MIADVTHGKQNDLENILVVDFTIASKWTAEPKSSYPILFFAGLSIRMIAKQPEEPQFMQALNFLLALSFSLTSVGSRRYFWIRI